MITKERKKRGSGGRVQFMTILSFRDQGDRHSERRAAIY